MANLSDEQYRVLLVFRCALRQYLNWSAEQAKSLGLTPQQHQLLLAVRAHPGDKPPSIGELADYLLIRHHSAVELTSRIGHLGMVVREPDEDDQRIVRVQLTAKGREVVEELATAHLAELERVAAQLDISEFLLERLSTEFIVELSGGDSHKLSDTNEVRKTG
ncbi:MAG: MarR family winged helix-turn-helix transcriptional regulator [Nocardioidaceae bacterium]